MKRSAKLYLKDILENMRFAMELTEGMDYDRFTQERNTHYAVIRCIEIVGEASKHIPENIQVKYSGIPWKKMAGMRDKLIHFYMGIDFEIVWIVVKKDFPSLIFPIERILSEFED